MGAGVNFLEQIRECLCGVKGFFTIVVEDGLLRHITPDLAARLALPEGEIPREVGALIVAQDWQQVLDAEVQVFGPLLGVRLQSSGGEVVFSQCLVAKGTVSGVHRVVLVGTLSQGALPAAMGGEEELGGSVHRIAHSIRTPLTSLIGLVELLNVDRLPSDMRTTFNSIIALASTIQNILRDVVDASQLEGGEMAIHRAPFNCRQLLERIIAHVALQHPQISLVLSYEPNVDEFLVGDAERLTQLFTNILTTCARYTPEGEVRLLVQNAENEREVRFTVRDTGVGMPPEILEHVFTPYATLQATYSGQTTGMSLYIARQIAALHEGTITCQSRQGKGTAFNITLPLRRPRARTATFGTDLLLHLPKDFPDTGRRSTHTRILVVDDSKINIMVVGKFLSRWGYAFDSALSGEECLAIVDSKPYGLIIMDIRMPGLNGFETAARIRSGGGVNAEVPILALTASTEAGVVQNIIESGMDSYVFKPFKADELQGIIAHFIIREE